MVNMLCRAQWSKLPELPIEVWELILWHIPNGYRVRFLLVCREWNYIIRTKGSVTHYDTFMSLVNQRDGDVPCDVAMAASCFPEYFVSDSFILCLVRNSRIETLKLMNDGRVPIKMMRETAFASLSLPMIKHLGFLGARYNISQVLTTVLGSDHDGRKILALLKYMHENNHLWCLNPSENNTRWFDHLLYLLLSLCNMSSDGTIGIIIFIVSNCFVRGKILCGQRTMFAAAARSDRTVFDFLRQYFDEPLSTDFSDDVYERLEQLMKGRTENVLYEMTYAGIMSDNIDLLKRLMTDDRTDASTVAGPPQLLCKPTTCIWMRKNFNKNVAPMSPEFTRVIKSLSVNNISGVELIKLFITFGMTVETFAQHISDIGVTPDSYSSFLLVAIKKDNIALVRHLLSKLSAQAAYRIPREYINDAIKMASPMMVRSLMLHNDTKPGPDYRCAFLDNKRMKVCADNKYDFTPNYLPRGRPARDY